MAVFTRDPKPSLTLQPGKAAAEAAGGEEGAPLWRLQSDAVNSRLLARWLPGRSSSLLKTDLYDEAVSPGLYPVLSEHAERVVGIDVSSEVAAAAAARHPGLEAVVADVRELPFEAESFDAVASISTLDHLSTRSDAEAALAEAARVLRPGGVLAITMDNPLNPAIALRNRLPVAASRRLRQDFPWKPGWTCGPRRLAEILAGAGLVVCERGATFHSPRAMVSRMRAGNDPPRRVERLMGMERLGRIPTRYLTGHFVAALAVKPTAGRS